MRVELSDAGDERFLTLAQAALGFDQRLRAGLSDKQLDAFRSVLSRLRDNVAAE